jgi:hypothetical protein
MSFALSSNLTQRSYTWDSWKLVCQQKQFIFQFDEDPNIYNIWGYDGPEVHTCCIWKNEVPLHALTEGYTQELNDSYKDDFELNFKSKGNKSLVKMTATGVAGMASARGLGGFTPGPTNNPYQPNADEIVGQYVDGEGSLITRGNALTDEGSFRDDFIGNSLIKDLTGLVSFTNDSTEITGVGTLFTKELNRDCYVKQLDEDICCWRKIARVPDDTHAFFDEPYPGDTITGVAQQTKWIQTKVGNSGQVSVDSSHVTLESGTDGYGGIIISREGDYLPIISTWSLSVSDRNENQTVFFGFRDDVLNPTMYCDVILDGNLNNKIIFRSAWNNDEQISVITLPIGMVTSQNLRYKLDVSFDYCALLVNGVLVTKHENHIPDMYAEMQLCAGIINNGNTEDAYIDIDTLFFSNQNQLQISSTFLAPLPVITREDQHSISSHMLTSSTTADQVILSYVVPDGKVFYIIGYHIESSGKMNGNPIKIGRNDISTEQNAPGIVDGNIFRSFMLAAGNSTGDVDFGGNPRKLGVGGDVIKITVTPSGSQNSTWRAALDFVLR